MEEKLRNLLKFLEAVINSKEFFWALVLVLFIVWIICVFFIVNECPFYPSSLVEYDNVINYAYVLPLPFFCF